MYLLRTLSLLLLIIILTPACSQEKMIEKNQKTWFSDLDYLVQLLKENHPNPYWLNDEAGHQYLIDKAKKTIQQEYEQEGFEEKMLTQFSQIIAYLGDGHTYVKNRFSLLGRLPFNPYPFSEGIFILSAAADKKECLGGKITHIDQVPIQEVLTRLKTTIPAANQSGIDRNIFRYLNIPGLLYGLGITKEKDQASLTIETPEGKIIETTFQRMSSEDTPNFLSARKVLEIPSPLYIKNPGKNYWFEYDSEKKHLFFRFTSEKQAKGEPKFKKFRKRLFQFIDQNPVDKFIIDIRHNGGGNGTIQCSILEDIITRPKINQRGKLFVLTSDWTYSAAIILATNLETKTKAIFVGEAPGDSPNNIGDNEPFTLPTSGLTFELSPFIWMNTFPFDERIELQPDLPIAYTFESYLQGKDLFLEAAYAYTLPSNRKKLEVEKLQKHFGRYEFSPGNLLNISQKGERITLDAPGKLLTELYPSDTSYYSTDLRGMKVEFPNEETVQITFSSGTSQLFKKLPQSKKVAMEYILEGDYKAALKAFQQLKVDYPSEVSLSGNNLVMQAYNLARMTGNWKIGLKLMKINTKINPGSWLAFGELAQMRVWQGKYIGAIGPGLKSKSISHYDVYKLPAASR